MVSGEVYERDILDIEVIAPLKQRCVRLIVRQTLLKTPAQFFVQLVQFKENTHIRRI